MDMNQLLKMGAQAFMNSKGSGNAGSNLDPGSLMAALSGLTGGNSGIDISALVGGMKNGGMENILQSWLGDGANDAISGEQINELLGSDKISAFASQLGISEQEAVGGLQDAMPKIVDNASSGGSLLDSVDGISRALGLARKLFAG